MESDTVLELLTEKVDPPLASVTASASPVDILDLSSPTAYDGKSQCSSRAPFENPEGTEGGLTVTDSPELEAEVEPEVELEADAESLTSSSDSEDGSEDNVQELTYFRFTRCGLSITVDLSVSARTPQPSAAEADVDMSATRDDSTLPIRPVKKEGSEQQQNIEQPQDDASERAFPVIWNGPCAAVNFEAACLEKYPACYPIGYRVGRFSKLQNTPLFPSTTSGASVSSSGVQALTSTTCSAPASVSAARIAPPCNAEQTSTLSAGTAVAPKPPSPGWSSAVESVAPGAPRPSAPTPRTEDRLSTVIQDILHRLNRQGTLADPRDLCRKGGGRSGQYYDKDDQFFDDSLTYEHLGLSSSFSPQHSPYSGGRRHRSATSKLGNEAHNNPCSFEDTLNDSFDDLSASGRGDDDDDDDEPIVYDYTDLTTFTCDNIPENDQLILLDDSAFVDEEQNDSASSSSVSDGVSGTEDDDDDGVGRDRDVSATSLNEKKGPVLVTTKHWIRRKAWREMESKLRPDLVEALVKLEHALRGKGTRKGLYVPPVDVARVCRETVREIFVKEYPKVAWNSSSFLASSYPEPTSLSSAMPRDLSHPNVPPAAKDFSLEETESLKTELLKPAKTVTALAPHVPKLGISSTSGSLPSSQCPTVVDLTVDDVVACQHEMVVKAADRPQQLSDFVHSGLPASNCCTAFSLQSSPPSFPMCFEPVLEIDLADDSSSTTPTLAKSKEPDVNAPSLDAPPSTDLTRSKNLTVAATLSDAPPSVDAVSDSKPVKCSTSGEGNNPSNEKKPRRQTLPPPSFQNTAATNDLVSLATCPALKQLGLCLMKMTNTVTPDLLKRWLMMRLVLHNQVIYSVLEERLFSFIVKKSSLFRTRGSYFFRSLKKAVDNYLKSLASSTNGAKTTPAAPQGRGATPVTPNDAGVTTPSLGQQEKQIASLERKTGTHSAMTTPGRNDGRNANTVPAQASLGTTSGAVPTVTQQEAANNATLGPPPDSPFAPVAKELLNWAVVYNCRRHELKELGETLDEWAAGFSAYAVEILNQSIQKRRRTGGSASGSLGTQQGGNTAASKKNRVWVPIKFLEETLMRFKEYYGVLTLYERRSRKPVIPQFITPCKGLHPPAVRAFRQHQNQTRGSAKQAPLVDTNKQQVPPETAALKQGATKDLSSSAVKKTPPLDSLVVTPPSNDGVPENNAGVAQVPLKKRRRKDAAAMGVPTRDGDTENNVAVQKKRKKPQQLLRTNGVSADGPKPPGQEEHQHNLCVSNQPSLFPAAKERSTVDDVVSSQPKPITINDYFLKIQKRDDTSKTQQPDARANVTTVQRFTAADDLAPKLTELSVSVLPECETHQDALPCQPSCARTPPVGIGVESTYTVRSPQRVVTSAVVPVVSSTKALHSSASVSPSEKNDTSHIFQKSGSTQQSANAIAIPQTVNSYLPNAPEQLHDRTLPLSSSTQSADTCNSNANVPFSCQAPPPTAQDKLVSQCTTTSPNNYRPQNDESYLHNPFMISPSTNLVSQQPDMRALSSALRGVWPVQQQSFSAPNLVTTTSSLPFPYMDTSNASGSRIPSTTLPEPQLPYTTDQHQTQRQLTFHQMALSWRPPLQVPLPASGLLTSSPLCSFPPNFLFMPTAASSKNFFYQTPVPATSEQAHHARWDTAATVPLMGICAGSSLSSMETSTNAPTSSRSGTTTNTPPALPHDNSSNARRSL